MTEFIEANFTAIVTVAIFIMGAFIAQRQRRLEKEQKDANIAKTQEEINNAKRIAANDTLIDNLQEEVSRLRTQSIQRDTTEANYYQEMQRIRTLVFRLQEDMIIFKTGVTVLTDQVRHLGATPAWTPPEVLASHPIIDHEEELL
jgi:hypothetical protein